MQASAALAAAPVAAPRQTAARAVMAAPRASLSAAGPAAGTSFAGDAAPLANSGRRATASLRAASRRGGAVIAAAARPWKEYDCRLVMEDGSEFAGYHFGAEGTRLAEIVFNTSLSGYQEILTDPSYKGQCVTFTHPHIGNTGINSGDMESDTVHLEAIVIRDYALTISNYRSETSLDAFLKENGVIGISGVDTREITRRLRNTGCLNGVVTTDMTTPVEELVAKTKEWTIVGKDLISEVTCKEAYQYTEATAEEWEAGLVLRAKPSNAKGNGEKYKIVAYDFGIKTNILRRLAAFGCDITVVPASTPASEVLAMNPDGVFLSNGPGDPSAVPYAVDAAKEIVGKLPVFGICMGHQILGQAFGAKTFKLPFGHHGGNHPIRYMPTGRIEVSAQNHNFAVDPATLPEGVEVTHINLNDGTCAGMVYPAMKALSIQYHPEAAPGPHDADVCFEMYIDMIRESMAAKVAA